MTILDNSPNKRMSPLAADIHDYAKITTWLPDISFPLQKINTAKNIPVFCLFLFIILLITGCSSGAALRSKRSLPEQAKSKTAISKPNSALVAIRGNDIVSLLDDLDQKSLLLAIERSLLYFERLKDNDVYYIGASQYTVRDMKETLRLFLNIITGSQPDNIKRANILEKFDIYQSIGDDGKGRVVFTGYYEPILNGSWTKTERYRYPIYRPPEGMAAPNPGNIPIKKEFPVMYKRSQIDGVRTLEGKNLELMWVDDAIDLFFLHVQGSGKIQLP
ncbi:MAG: MltA domain-containing protein, partial [Syntrophales bacterium LBB04]|nr:MltA domain-containing protein [Syntrophales bacterium LBB04]